MNRLLSSLTLPARASVLLLTSVLVLAGCGGGSGGASAPGLGGAPAPASAPTPETGELAIAVTDAEGDFVVYEVEVVRIDLLRGSGDEVQAVPTSTRIDFAELTELSELLTIATVPAGTYTAIELLLDFTDAVVLIQDAAGELRVAALQDAAGAPLGMSAVRVTIGDGSPVRIAAGTPARISLDFDLDASNEILSFDPAVVRVQPFVLVTPEFDETRDVRVTGTLQGVGDDGVITVEVQPLRQRPATVGEIAFTTDAQTAWEIDDASFQGEAGLDALANVPVGTFVLAAGPVGAGAFVADVVLVGSAVPGADSEVVAGTVLARSGNALTLGGVRVFSLDGPDRFLRRATLTVDATTTVTLRGAGRDGGAEVGIAALSTGARVVADAVQTAAATETVQAAFDAAGRRARLLRSTLTAQVVSTDPFIVDLIRLDGRRPGVFDFAGTGPSPGDDADPSAYEIDPGVLSVGQLAVEDLVRVRGLVADFGTAPPDFAAETLVDLETHDRAALLRAGFGDGGSTAVLAAVGADRIGLDLAGSDATLRVRGVLRDVLPADGMLDLVPGDGGRLVLALRDGPAGEIRIFEDFAQFADALLAGTQAGAAVVSLAAEGRYDRAEGELRVRRVRIEWAL